MSRHSLLPFRKRVIPLAILISVLAFSLAVAGCKGKHDEVQGTPLVEINGKPITQEDLVQQYQMLDQPSKEKYEGRDGILRLLDDMISIELLYQEASRQKLDEQENVKYQIERVKKDILINSMINNSVKPADIYRLFQLNYVRAKTIFARIDPDDPASEAKAKKRIDAIYDKLQKGQDFDEIAKKDNDTPNADRDAGDIGYVSKEMAIDLDGVGFQTALFDLKEPGDVSQPVKGKNGYFIIMLTEARGNLSQDAPPRLKQMIAQQKQNEIYFGTINELKSRPETKIERNVDNIKSFLDEVDKMNPKAGGAGMQAGSTASPAEGESEAEPKTEAGGTRE